MVPTWKRTTTSIWRPFIVSFQITSAPSVVTTWIPATIRSKYSSSDIIGAASPHPTSARAPLLDLPLFRQWHALLSAKFRRANSSTKSPLSQDRPRTRSEEHTSELQSLMRISYAVFCLNKKKTLNYKTTHTNNNDK